MTHVSIHLSIQRTSAECPTCIRDTALGREKMTPPHFIYILSSRHRTKHFLCLFWLSVVSPIVQVGKLELTEIQLMPEVLKVVSNQSWGSNPASLLQSLCLCALPGARSLHRCTADLVGGVTGNSSKKKHVRQLAQCSADSKCFMFLELDKTNHLIKL